MHTANFSRSRSFAHPLVSVLYHTQQGAHTYDQYIADAEENGDDELAGFFPELPGPTPSRLAGAARAKRLLGARLE